MPYRSGSSGGDRQLEVVERMAHECRLDLIYLNKHSKVISFHQNAWGPKGRMNVYYSTGTVATCLEHPRSGLTQLFRKNVCNTYLRELMLNPRLHTGIGYYKVRIPCDRDPSSETVEVRYHQRLKDEQFGESEEDEEEERDHSRRGSGRSRCRSSDRGYSREQHRDRSRDRDESHHSRYDERNVRGNHQR